VLGNLKRVDLPTGDVIEYLVDGQNRRVGKKRNGVLLKQWLYRDQLHPVAELDGAGNLVARFVWASGKNAPDVLITGGVTYRLLSDQLGSPRMLVNASTGATAGAMRQDPWGGLLEDSLSTLLPFGFAGGLFDAETGLVRFGARDYDPSVGRWVSKDPIRFDAAGTNLYAYALNDPVNVVDRDGRNPLVLLGLCAFGGCEAVAAAAAAAAATTVAAIACIASGTCGKVADKIADKVDDMCRPRTPNPPDDCAQQRLGHLDPGAVFPGSDGHMYRNDRGGNHAFQRCVAECRRKTIN
jgi:RHS repeat-associated protein